MSDGGKRPHCCPGSPSHCGWWCWAPPRETSRRERVVGAEHGAGLQGAGRSETITMLRHVRLSAAPTSTRSISSRSGGSAKAGPTRSAAESAPASVTLARFSTSRSTGAGGRFRQAPANCTACQRAASDPNPPTYAPDGDRDPPPGARISFDGVLLSVPASASAAGSWQMVDES
jgi:hypothetical protein